MRSPRLLAFPVVLALAVTACSGGSSSSSSDSSAQHFGMTPAQTRCMDSRYAAKHHELCVHGKGSMTFVAPVETAKPLHYLPDGTIDPTRVDLSGVPGVTPAQTKESEQLLVKTLKVLPQWSDYQKAIADGFQSIGDGLTGEEHVIHWDWIDDNDIFDPSHPESLVYRVDRATGTKTLEAAMYIMPKQYDLDHLPSIASPLVQFHIHNNLCFTPGPAPRVAGLTNAQGGCNAPLQQFNPNPMVHVWIRANDCGPFAALIGIGAGQTKSGQRNCDHDHGKLTL